MFLFLMVTLMPGLHAQQQLTKPVSIVAENEPLQEVLHQITNQTGLNFSYNSRHIDPDQIVTISIESQPLEKVLEALAGQIRAEYKLVRNQIILKPKKPEPAEKKTFTISGYILDRKTGETLPGATVRLDTASVGTISNAYGFYSLTLPREKYTLRFSYIGYTPHLQQIDLENDRKISVELTMKMQQLEEVAITAGEEAEQLEKSQMSKIRVNPSSLLTLPEFAGEVGLVKSLQTLPGIKTHSDGSAFFFVRGGNKDQNLILIDEAPVYNPAHLFGYYSVIIPDVAKEINIYKGDFPLQKGDRLSSVIEVVTKDGNMKKTEVNGMLNPLIYRLSLEGPIAKSKSSYFASFRHSNFGWLIRRDDPDNDVYLYDLNGKLNWQINNKNRVFFSFYYGKDDLINRESGGFGGIRWYNVTSTLRWNHLFNNRHFANAVMYTSTYDYSLFTGNVEWNSYIRNFGLKYDLSFFPSPGQTLRYGISFTSHDFNPGNLVTDQDNPFLPEVPTASAAKLALYAGVEHGFSERLSFKAGFRLPIWINSGPALVYQYDTNYQVADTLLFQDGETVKAYAGFDPRFSLKYRTGASSSLKFSMGVYHQYLNLISNSISPFSSFEIWLPAGENIRPQRAQQVAVGYQAFPGNSGLEVNIEAYYKKMVNQIDYEPHANLLLNPLLEGELRFGDARSYGVEFLLRKAEGRLSGWLSYTWSRALMKIDEINDGKEFPAYYDRPHDFSVYLSWKYSPTMTFSLNWTYYTGSAITTPIGFYDYNGYTVPLYGEKNNDRLPDYHRLDVALAWMLNKPGNKFQHSLTFGIYNVYNRHNAVSVNFNKTETRNGNFVVPANLFGSHEIVTTQKYLLGILPSITYKFKL